MVRDPTLSTNDDNIVYMYFISNLHNCPSCRSKLSPGQYLHTHPSADYDQGKSLAATMLSPVTTKALALDFKETEQQYELDIDFPGMNRDQINIRSDGNVLTISGERKFLKANEDGKYHKVERSVTLFLI